MAARTRAALLCCSGPPANLQSQQVIYSINTMAPTNASSSSHVPLDGGCRVFVGNLPWSVESSALEDHLRTAGDIVSASVLESNGRSKGCGVVEFASASGAQCAIEQFNGSEFHGRQMIVRYDRDPKSRAPGLQRDWVVSSVDGAASARVYVGNLSWTVKSQQLQELMETVGTVHSCDVVEEPSGRSKGYGLVEFASPVEAQQAITTLTNTELQGRKIFVREDRNRSHRSAPETGSSMEAGVVLYVGNLPWDVTWQTLKDVFQAVGEVERAQVAQFPDGKSRGFGIVRFARPEDAATAIEQLNGTDLDGRVIEVRYDKGRL